MQCFFLFVVLAIANAGHDDYKRTVLMIAERYGPPPNQNTIIDVDHNQMRDFPIFTSVDIDSLNTETFDFLLDGYGLNFSQATYNPTFTTYTLFDSVNTSAILATLVPFATNQDKLYKIVYDSMFPNRRNWIMQEFGNIVIMAKSGTFTTGGQGFYVANDLIVVSKCVFINDDANDITKPHNHEITSIYSIGTGKQTANSFGLLEQTFKLNVYDGSENHGTNLVITSSKVDAFGNITRYVSNTMFFDW